jgi:hypothetical protein
MTRHAPRDLAGEWVSFGTSELRSLLIVLQSCSIPVNGIRYLCSLFKIQHLMVKVENRENIKVESYRVYRLLQNFKATYFLHYWRKENCSITGGEVGKMIHNHSLTLNVGSVTSVTTTVQRSLP